MRTSIRIFITLMSCLIFITSSAQVKELELSDLKPPTSPGFTLLDITPNSIERPKTAREFTISTFNLLKQDFTIPQNFSFEIVPAWMTNRDKLSFSKITGLKITDKSIKQNIFSDLRFTSLSIASVFNDSASTQLLQANTNHISYGIKLNVIKIYGKKRLEAIGRTIQTINDTTGRILDEIDPTQPDDSIANSIRKSTKELWKNVIDLRSLRPNFQLQLAGASSTAFPDNKGGQYHRSGGWLTAGLSLPLLKAAAKGEEDNSYARRLLDNKNFVNIMLLGRVIDSKFDSIRLEKSQTLIDIGGRLELELDKLLMGFEYISRSGNNEFENTHRMAGIIEYKILKDIFIIGTFGKNFGDYDNVITLLGINWGFGKKSLFKEFK